MSPIYNYGTYANIKKRLEAAHEISENLKYVLKDLDGMRKVHVGRLSRFLDHWAANSGIKGVQEIELSQEVLKQAGKDLRSVSEQVQAGNESNDLSKLAHLKAIYSQVQVDFSQGAKNDELTKLEPQVRLGIWRLELRQLRNDESEGKKLDFYQFKALVTEADFNKEEHEEA